MKKYAVIGNPVAQSWSPFIHQQFARQTQIDLSYSALAPDCPTGISFEKTLLQLCHAGYNGLNVTLPYKLFAFAAFQKKHELSAYAEKSGAVNTITFLDQNRWLGDNTDGIGLVSDLKNNLSWPLQDIDILVLGAGGAARGAIFALIQEKPACIHILNRDTAKTENLVNYFANDDIQIKRINSVSQHPYHLIINATSASLWQQLPTTISQLNAKNAYCYDMVYSAMPTVFLAWAKAAKAKNTSDGLGMLVEQAAASFYQWHDVMPNTLPVIQSLRHRL